MTHRGYRNVGGETRLDSFRDYDRAPNSYAANKGFCSCGVETSRSVTIGPPGHPGNGWECAQCGEARLQAEFASTQAERYLRKP
jgi:hypothetical protein